MDIVKLIERKMVGGGGGEGGGRFLFEDETHLAFSFENSKFGFPILNG